MNELLTTKELAAFLKVDPSTLWHWRKRGLPALKIGYAVRFDKEKVLEWIESNARMD